MPISTAPQSSQYVADRLSTIIKKISSGDLSRQEISVSSRAGTDIVAELVNIDSIEDTERGTVVVVTGSDAKARFNHLVRFVDTTKRVILIDYGSAGSAALHRHSSRQAPTDDLLDALFETRSHDELGDLVEAVADLRKGDDSLRREIASLTRKMEAHFTLLTELLKERSLASGGNDHEVAEQEEEDDDDNEVVSQTIVIKPTPRRISTSGSTRTMGYRKPRK